MLEVGTFFMRSESELVLKSRCAIPLRLVNSGFQFRFSFVGTRPADLCRRMRER